MMQFRLSTIFLIIFNVAATLALFGTFGLLIAVPILIFALCMNRGYRLTAILFIFAMLGFIIALLMPAQSASREVARRMQSVYNLKQIGLALHNYHDANNHFPMTNTYYKDGKPLFSWRVEILPMLAHGDLYDSVKRDEPWNSPYNFNVLNRVLPEYKCPCAQSEKNDCFTNYIAIIGPGTAWREDGPVKISDLPDGGSHTVMAVEVMNSGVHWAEPRDLTVEEALERMKIGKGLRISTAHPSVIHILFADGAVRSLPAKMPISIWRNILAGEVIDLDNIRDNIDESASDMVDVHVDLPVSTPNIWAITLGVLVWLLSVVLLFRRAIKSRRKPEEI